jgi:hypothetical protein
VTRCGAVRPRGVDEILKVADGADVIESAFLAERDARRVVAAILESAESAEE